MRRYFNSLKNNGRYLRDTLYHHIYKRKKTFYKTFHCLLGLLKSKLQKGKRMGRMPTGLMTAIMITFKNSDIIVIKKEKLYLPKCHFRELPCRQDG